MKKTKKKIGELMQEAGLIDDFQLNSALAYQKEWGGRLGSIFIKKGFVTEEKMASVIGRQFGLSCTSLDGIRPPLEALNMIKVDTAKKFGIFPVKLEGKTLVLAMADPTDLKTLDELGFVLGFRLKPVLALESDIMRAIGVNYEGKFDAGPIIDRATVSDRISAAKAAAAATAGRNDEIVIERTGDIGRKAPALSNTEVEVSSRAGMEALIDLLVAKGVFTREEFLGYLRSRPPS